MRIPSNTELLAAWERGSSEKPVDRALTLLSMCMPEPRNDLARLSIGARDRTLIALHELLFGPTLDAFAECPFCSEAMEYSMSTRDLLASVDAADPAALILTTDHGAVTLRTPDSTDLQAICDATDPASAATRLVERCIVHASTDGQAVPIASLPPQVLDRIPDALAAADPAAEILILLSCSRCSHTWQISFDVEPFLWSKLSARAKRLLHEVHTIASTYGWSEPEILNLSPARRQSYVEMAWTAS